MAQLPWIPLQPTPVHRVDFWSYSTIMHATPIAPTVLQLYMHCMGSASFLLSWPQWNLNDQWMSRGGRTAWFLSLKFACVHRHLAQPGVKNIEIYGVLWHPFLYIVSRNKKQPCINLSTGARTRRSLLRTRRSLVQQQLRSPRTITMWTESCCNWPLPKFRI